MQRFILILGLISLFMDWYVYQGVKKLSANWRSRKLRLLVRWVYWLFFVGILVGFGFAIYTRFAHDRATPLVQWFINAFLTLFVTKLVFILVLFAEDIYRFVAAAFNFIRHGAGRKGSASRLLPQRRKFVSQLALVLAAIPFGAFLYGVTKGKYAYKVHRPVVYFPDLPEAFDGFKILQLSDLHAGSFDDAAAVQRGVDLAQEQQADLIVFTGDMVNNLASEMTPYLKSFAQLKAPYGQFSVLGNHDYGMYHQWPSEKAKNANLQQLKQHHATMGFRLLLDENTVIQKNGQALSLLGVENWGRGFIQLGDISKAMAGVADDAFKILLSHDPSHWTEVVQHFPSHIHLTLAGHTHGMQFGVETPLVKWSPVQYRYSHWAGLLQQNNKMLYINRGFGFIGFSGRVGIWPEITVLELRRGSS